jgi:RNA polymerase sigma factor (sigma-70 family)
VSPWQARLRHASRTAERLKLRRAGHLLVVSYSETERQRFAAVFLELSPRIYSFARRHCDPVSAQDVTAETFLVAWRRMDQLPDAPLPWLLGIARNVLRNQVRATIRRDRLVEAITSVPATSRLGQAADAEPLERSRLAEALTQLTDRERESLLLVAWDGLTPAQAAAVTGCSANTFARRLSRARARLTAALEGNPDPPRRRKPSLRPSPAPTAPQPTNR